jgi:hypothetical protein
MVFYILIINVPILQNFLAYNNIVYFNWRVYYFRYYVNVNT